MVTDLSGHFPIVYVDGESKNMKLKIDEWNATIHLKAEIYFMRLFNIDSNSIYQILTLRGHLLNFVINQS